MKTIILAMWLLTSLGLLAGSKKDDRLVIQFNLQGSDTDGPKMSVPQEVAGKRVFFRISPEIWTKDIESFRPFPADDGVTYGMMFKLDQAAQRRLAAITSANRGKLMVARMNGRALDVIQIDQPVRDGLLVVWQGVTTREIGLADQVMPRIGQTNKEWKAQRKK